MFTSLTGGGRGNPLSKSTQGQAADLLGWAFASGGSQHQERGSQGSAESQLGTGPGGSRKCCGRAPHGSVPSPLSKVPLGSQPSSRCATLLSSAHGRGRAPLQIS